MHRLFPAIVLCFVVLSIPSARAQQPAAGQPGPSQPGVQHKQIAALEGSWDAAVTFKFGSGPEQHGTAKVEAKLVLDGRFLHMTYQSMMFGKPFTVVQILGYDTHRKKFVEIFMENVDTSIVHNEGTISDDGKTFTASGTIDDMEGKPAKLRTVYTIADKDHFTLDWYMTPEGGPETKSVSLVHTRRKAEK